MEDLTKVLKTWWGPCRSGDKWHLYNT